MTLKRELFKFTSSLCSLMDLSSFTNSSEAWVSANLLCKNNYRSLELCLRSLLAQDLIREIVIVDSGSTDGSIECIQQLATQTKTKIKLIQEAAFKGYSYHRNQALANSNGDWILAIDSDEFLSQELALQIPKLIRSKIYSAYLIYRHWISSINPETRELKYIINEQSKGRYKASLRLFRKQKGLEYRGEIHESLFGCEWIRSKKLSPNNSVIYHLDIAINNYEYRLAKVRAREALRPGSGHPEEYLAEDYEMQEALVEKKADLDLLFGYLHM